MNNIIRLIRHVQIPISEAFLLIVNRYSSGMDVVKQGKKLLEVYTKTYEEILDILDSNMSLFRIGEARVVMKVCYFCNTGFIYY
jgi:hypothetical protein